MRGPDYTLDLDRKRRVGFPEVVLAQGKSSAQIAEIIRQLSRAHDVLVTRLEPEMWDEVANSPLPGRADYDARSGTLHVSVGKPMPRLEASVVVVTAGTADTVIAEEARRTLEYLGVASTLVPDVGVAGLLRLLSRLEEIERADVLIAVAGMEGSLFSVLGGLVGRPIIAVPTSRGYGAAFQGAVSSWTVAMFNCANPKCPATSMAVTTAWCVVRASARIVMGPRSVPASFNSAARNVSGLELIKVRSLTR